MSEHDEQRDHDNESKPKDAADPTEVDDRPVDYASPGTDDDAADQLVLSPPDAASAPRDFALWAGVLFLLALTVYGLALRGQFLWDDDRHVTQNLALRTFDGLGRIWFAPGTTPQYYPLTHTTYWFEYQFLARGTDGELNPLVFHVTNVLLHATAATLLWFILRRLRVPGAWVAAAVFALHPVHVESVAWVSERKNVLSAALMFGSILAYLRFARVGDEVEGSAFRVQGSEGASDASGSSALQRGDGAQPDWQTYALSLALFLAAMLSKTVACSAPAVLLVLLWWKRRLDKRHLVLLVPFFVLGLALAGVTAWMEQSHVIGRQMAAGDWDLSPAQRILIAGRAVWFYLYKLVVPTGLAFIYPRWDVKPADAVQWVYPIGVIAVLSALWALRRRIGRAPLAAGLIYVGALVPALGFVNVYPMRYSFVANHFQYHASAAAIAAIVAALALLLRRVFGIAVDATSPAPSPAAPPATVNPSAADPSAADSSASNAAAAPQGSPMPYITAGALLLALVVFTWRLAGVYDNPVSLWEDTIAKNPDAWMAYHNLGTTLMNSASAYAARDKQDLATSLRLEAVERLKRAIELRPQHTSARNNLAVVLLALNRVPEALDELREATRRDPDHVESLANTGVALDRLDKPDEALAAFERALAASEAQPPPRPGQSGRIRQHIGRILAREKRDDVALAAYRAAADALPNDVSVQYEYGLLLARQGRPETDVTAAGAFAAALKRDNRHIDSWVELARLQIKVRNLRGAQASLQAAAAIDQQNSKLLEVVTQWSQAVAEVAASTQPGATQPGATQPTTPSTSPASPKPATLPAPEPLPAAP